MCVDLGAKAMQTHGGPFTFSEIKEKGMPIDWENAAGLNSPDVSAELTNRTVSFWCIYQSYPQSLMILKSTPMFVAVSVVMGEVRAKKGRHHVRDGLPKMKPATKEWYIKTYGQERYDCYWVAMEKLDELRKYDPDKYSYSHRAFHDAESFVWVIVNELLRAWPKGYEEELTDIACRHIYTLENHELGEGADIRSGFFNISISKWKSILHPRLAFLAPMLDTLMTYFSVEWLLWPERPEDHGHEVVNLPVYKLQPSKDNEESAVPLQTLLDIVAQA